MKAKMWITTHRSHVKCSRGTLCPAPVNPSGKRPAERTARIIVKNRTVCSNCEGAFCSPLCLQTHDCAARRGPGAKRYRISTQQGQPVLQELAERHGVQQLAHDGGSCSSSNTAGLQGIRTTSSTMALGLQEQTAALRCHRQQQTEQAQQQHEQQQPASSRDPRQQQEQLHVQEQEQEDHVQVRYSFSVSANHNNGLTVINCAAGAVTQHGQTHEDGPRSCADDCASSGLPVARAVAATGRPAAT